MSFQEILSREQKFAAGDKILTLKRNVIEVHSHSVCCLCNTVLQGRALSGVQLVSGYAGFSETGAGGRYITVL